MADFSEALARAKQLAAKFSAPSVPPSNGTPPNVGVKRPADGYDDSPPSSLKRPTPVNDKVAQAAEIAARLNQKIGGPTNPNAVIGNALGAFGENKQTIVHKVPDGYVGLIIGKKGEQITRIQRESGCNVQIAPDSGGLPDRAVTLTGTQEQIDAVKRMFQEIINNAKPPTAPGGVAIPNSGPHTIEISVPGQRAGLIIGKSGETIKQLQEQTGTKMVLIQESNAPTEADKPLRISGDYASVEKAKQMVLDLLNSRGVGQVPNAYGNKITSEFPVPAEKAGLVIGRGGETIKDISRQSGARLEIQKQPPPNPSVKIFSICGEQSQIDHAIRLICERANIPYPAQAGQAVAPQYGAGYYGADPYVQSAWAQQAVTGQWAQGAMQAAQPAAAAATPAPSINPQTGQPDYTAAWVEYYRRQGMNEQANAILRMSQSGAQPQVQSQSQPVAPQQQQPQQQQPVTNPSPGGGYDYSQWQQYQQWQQQTQSQQQPQPQQHSQYGNPNPAWNQPQHAPGTGGGVPPRS